MPHLKTEFLEKKAPLLSPFRGLYLRSNAYYTLSERIPILLTKLIDYFSRTKNQGQSKYGQICEKDFQVIVKSLVELKHNIVTNKKLTMFSETMIDSHIWNQIFETNQNFFSEPAILIESYINQKLNEITETKFSVSNKFDIFQQFKLDFYKKSLHIVDQVLNKYTNLRESYNEQTLEYLLMLDTWSSIYDVAYWLDKDTPESFFESIDLSRPFLVNDCRTIWKFLIKQNNHNETMNVICNNFGLESIADFILADYLIFHKCCEKVTFFPKNIPWNVSDSTEFDLCHLLDMLTAHYETNVNHLSIVNRWKLYFSNGTWNFISSKCWTLPIHYHKQITLNENDKFQIAKLNIVKGDYHFRRFFNDINWPSNTKLCDALNETIRIYNWCFLRVIKSDLLLGLCDQMKFDYDSDSFIGKYATIQLYIGKN